MSNLCLSTTATAYGSVTVGSVWTAGSTPTLIRDDNTASEYGVLGMTISYSAGVTLGGYGVITQVDLVQTGRFSNWVVLLGLDNTWTNIMGGTSITGTGPFLVSTTGIWNNVYAVSVSASGTGIVGPPPYFQEIPAVHACYELRLWGDSVIVPSVISVTADEISPTTARIHGSVSSTGGSVVTTRGFDHGPTTGYGASYATTGSFGIETFDALLSALPVNSPYHFRANAYNIVGWGYGSDIEFYTVSGDEEIKRMSRLVYDEMMDYMMEDY